MLKTCVVGDFHAEDAPEFFGMIKSCVPRNAHFFNIKKSSNLEDFLLSEKVQHVILLGNESLNMLCPNRPSFISMLRIRGVDIPHHVNGQIMAIRVTYDYEETHKGFDEVTRAFKRDLRKSPNFKSLYTKKINPEIIQCEEYSQIKECFGKLKTADRVAFDFETTQLKPFVTKQNKNPKIYSVAFAFPDNTCYAIPLKNYWDCNKSVVNGLARWFTSVNPKQIKIAHNVKFDLLWALTQLCGNVGANLDTSKPMLCGDYHDTQFMAWLLDERTTCSRLKSCVWRYLGQNDYSIEFTDTKGGEDNGISKYDRKDVLHYNGLDSAYTLILYDLFKLKFQKRPRMWRVYTNIMLPAAMQFLKMELNGVPVDMEKLAKFDKSYEKVKSDSYHKLIKITNIDGLKPNSRVQLADYFAHVKKYKLTKRTTTGFAVDNLVLDELIKKYKDPAAKHILEYRIAGKMHSTYIHNMYDHIDVDNVIHANVNQTSTVTCRTSYSNPNLQNFPHHKNKEIRGIIKAPDGYLFVACDYGQIEARVYGMITGDKTFIKVLKDNYDIHLENSKILFGEKDAKKMRTKVKFGTFAMLYGAGDKTVGKAAGVSDMGKIAKLRKLFFNKFTAFKPWQRRLLSEEKELNRVISLFGRYRRSPIKFSDILNYIPQSSASDMTLISMNSLGRKYRMAFMIHDDLSFFIKKSPTLSDDIEYIMRGMLTLPWTELKYSPDIKCWTPLSVECKVGTNWDDLKVVCELDSHTAGYNDLKSSVDAGNKIKKEMDQIGW